MHPATMYSTASSEIGGFYNRRPLEADVLDKEGYSGFLPEVSGPRDAQHTLESSDALTAMWR